MANIKCGHCQQTHHSVQEVRECGIHPAIRDEATGFSNLDWAQYKNESARLEAEAEQRAAQAKMDREAVAIAPRLGYMLKDATERQLTLLNKLATERGLLPRYKVGDMTKKQASDEISRLMAQPKVVAQEQQRRGEPEDGIYVFDESGEQIIYKVYKMVHGSGRQGLKRLQPITDGSRKGQFRYVGLASRNLPHHARKMTIEEAKEFGKLYGFCVACGATLTDETSIANGIGPICGAKGW